MSGIKEPKEIIIGLDPILDEYWTASEKLRRYLQANGVLTQSNSEIFEHAKKFRDALKQLLSKEDQHKLEHGIPLV